MLNSIEMQADGFESPGLGSDPRLADIDLKTLCDIYRRVFQELRPRTKVPHFAITFRRFANANSFIRMDADRIDVRMTDVLEGAPQPILEALAHILLSKLFRKSIPREISQRYRRYLNRKEIRENLAKVRKQRGWKQITAPKGDIYDLEEIFEEINFQYFHGLMVRPVLGWGLRPSRTTLGHYDPSHHAIVLSKILDRKESPRLAAEYVMFHEMLHLRYPVEHKGLRRCVHTPEFKLAEKSFLRLKEAKEALRRL